MHKYENCIVKCKNKEELEKLYNNLFELLNLKDNLYNNIDHLYKTYDFNEDEEIWISIEYVNNVGYMFYFRTNSVLNEWSNKKEIPYHTFFRKEKIINL